jgi:hypothetical protein
MFSESETEAPEEIKFSKEAISNYIENSHPKNFAPKLQPPKLPKNNTDNDFYSQTDFVSLVPSHDPKPATKRNKIKLGKYALSPSELDTLKRLKGLVSSRPVERKSGALGLRARLALKPTKRISK